MDCVASKQADASICLFIAERCAILPVDYLGFLCKSKFKDSKAAHDFSLHRTKCSAIIRNVISPHSVDTLISDIGDG